MSMFSKQPVLPPHIPDAAPAPTPRRGMFSRPRSQPLAPFALVGVDHQTGQTVSTVIEARSEDEAQQIALRRGLTVHVFKEMNTSSGNPGAHGAQAEADLHHDLHETRYHGVRQVPPTPRAAVLCVGGVLLVAAGLLWTGVIRDGGLTDLAHQLVPGPGEVAAAIDVTEPHGVDLSALGDFQHATADTALADLPTVSRDVLRLEAIVPPRAGDRGYAVIAGLVVRPGQTVKGYRVVSVRDDFVLLQHDGRLVALRMAATTPN